MKIIILSGLYPPNNQGGAEKVAAALAKELTALGHAVTVVTTGKKNAIENNNGRIYILPPRNIFWYGEIGRYQFFIRSIWHLIDLFNFSEAQAVKKILVEEKPDLVWSHNLKGLGFLIPRTIKKLGIRHVHTLHDIQLLVPSGVATTRPRLGLYGLIMHQLFGSPDIVTSPSAWLLDLYKQHGFFKKSHTVVLPHVFDNQKNLSSGSENKQRLLFLGQLEATKGLPFLIEVARENNLPLTIVGNGSLQPYVKNSGMDYRGQLSGEALEKIWSEIKFLIVPSLIIENSPTVILEAFSHGVPVVASNIGGIPELVRDGENGFLFAPGNALSLKEALEKAKLADYASLSQKALARYQVLRREHAKVLGEILS